MIPPELDGVLAVGTALPQRPLRPGDPVNLNVDFGGSPAYRAAIPMAARFSELVDALPADAYAARKRDAVAVLEAIAANLPAFIDEYDRTVAMNGRTGHIGPGKRTFAVSEERVGIAVMLTAAASNAAAALRAGTLDPATLARRAASARDAGAALGDITKEIPA